MQAARAASRAASSAASVGSASTSFLRSFGPLGRALRDRPDGVHKSQEHFAHKTADTYWARSGDKFSVGGVLALTALNMILLGAGVADGLTGSNKKM